MKKPAATGWLATIDEILSRVPQTDAAAAVE
jgi:hypothetical protein